MSRFLKDDKDGNAIRAFQDEDSGRWTIQKFGQFNDYQASEDFESYADAVRAYNDGKIEWVKL
jgi:hypothetical protein